MVSESTLFCPLKVGNLELQHRVVLAPLTRRRATDARVPGKLHIEYYTQRATSGGLLITEGIFISPSAGGYRGVTGIYNDDQIRAWKAVTDAVHAKGGYIFLQLWHVGRATDPSLINGQPIVSASPIPILGISSDTGKAFQVPHALSIDEIKHITNDYAQAARNAMAAGFDGVEIHGANGYLIDQFLNSSSNTRTDAYGGSPQKRGRFALEVVDAVTAAVGHERVGLRLSPWSEFQDVKDDAAYETWGHLVSQLQAHHPNLAYIHMVEPRDDFARTTKNDVINSLDPFRAIWKGTFISAGGYTTRPELARKVADDTGNLIAIGRAFIANPDLVDRLKNGWELNKYDRKTFYTPGPVGYIDYPTYAQLAGKSAL
ncbi:hypothetical protein BX666DRAFT_1847834 [Dichotomocladium elegans]|nr:hypothetical protein BX666DRAFT_1847184 [Dichotomocladium elegans]KAI9323288.1 hypothetical protein BX666DRAFT_1847834 [Dichotomocladium elegans]